MHVATSWGSWIRRYPIPIATLLFIVGGWLVVPLTHQESWRRGVWIAGLLLTSAPVLRKTVMGMMRGRFAADLVAALAVVASLLLMQPLVGLVIVLMQSGGESLERIAEGRATTALRALEDAAPQTVRLMTGERIDEVKIDLVSTGDTLLIRPGEMIPCDGEIVKGNSHLDTSSITGESMPERVVPGSMVMSGTLNQESPLVLRVLAIANESQYARIVALVREAQASKAPLQRIADKYAVLFTPFTILVCAGAYVASGDWNRVLAVLAIATPCPLILATPVAILGGMNRSARRQILIRNGGALEALGQTTAVLFDKTGTLTVGRPQVARVVSAGSLLEPDLLRLASAVEQGSGHLLARTLVAEAERRGLVAEAATAVIESPGRGVEGDVEGLHVAVGARSFIADRSPTTATGIQEFELAEGSSASLRAYVAVGGGFVGVVEYSDAIRKGMKEFVQRLEVEGVRQIALISGDRSENATAVAAAVGIKESHGDMLPQDKVRMVQQLLDQGEKVVMMGDGTNDAPALSTATIGVALASQGRGIATEAADVILLGDDPSQLSEGMQISRRTMRIARQSIWFGLGISALGMAFASGGWIPPVAGAAIQEAIDLLVIANALRASRDGM